MDRREFFKYGLTRISETVSETMTAARGSPDFLPPPYALPKEEFLAACTRCNACIEACPHDVIFALDDNKGQDRAGLPAMDLLNKGCHLCADWPCVVACEPGALMRHDSEEDQMSEMPPKLAVAEIDREACLPWRGPECGACAGSCPVDGALVWKGTRPDIDADLCVGCGLCREACIASPKAVLISLPPLIESTPRALLESDN